MKTLFQIIFISLCASGCASNRDPLQSLVGSYRDYVKIKGKIENDRYYSPATNFSCAVPSLVKPGAVINDFLGPEGGTVSFQDDMGTLVRVDYFEIPSEASKNVATIDGRKSMANLIFDFTLEKMYRPIAPQTEVKHKEFIELTDKDTLEKVVALFAIAMLPKASTLAEVKRGRYDALRASLIFAKGKFSYSITVQDIPSLYEGLRTTKLSDEERNKRLLNKLEKFYETCLFTL